MADIQKAFGERLRAIRKSKGLTQEELAEKGEINFKYYGAIERGEVNITLKTIAGLAKILDVKINELFAFDLLLQQKEKTEIIARITQILKRGDKDQIKRLKIFLDEVFE
jgi:transcriptional regulator with XRE-family HTH domain